jgi:anthraniloyl-CoA monooxygenase
MDSLRWFENMADYAHLDPLPFAVEAMTRSKRVDFDKLKQRDPEFAARVVAAGVDRSSM